MVKIRVGPTHSGHVVSQGGATGETTIEIEEMDALRQIAEQVFKPHSVQIGIGSTFRSEMPGGHTVSRHFMLMLEPDRGRSERDGDY